eukprot:gene2999-5877_t
MFIISILAICIGTTAGFLQVGNKRAVMQQSLKMEICLHGSQQTRSPLVNWYLYEKNIPFTQKFPRPSEHPFGQVPYLTDGSVGVFESGAILLYLADAYGGNNTPQERASYTKWVVWANSELDGLCFGKGMSGSQLDKPNKALDTLENLLSKSDWLVNNEFSVADVAVGSYLNYVPVFFRNVNPSSRPNMLKYMARCAERPAFEKAFGADHAGAVKRLAASCLGQGESSSGKKTGWF